MEDEDSTLHARGVCDDDWGLVEQATPGKRGMWDFSLQTAFLFLFTASDKHLIATLLAEDRPHAFLPILHASNLSIKGHWVQKLARSLPLYDLHSHHKRLLGLALQAFEAELKAAELFDITIGIISPLL